MGQRLTGSEKLSDEQLRKVAAIKEQIERLESQLNAIYGVLPSALDNTPPRGKVVAKLVKRGGAMFFEVPPEYTLDPQDIGQAVKEERESRS
jgi:hypothetical protein